MKIVRQANEWVQAKSNENAFFVFASASCWILEYTSHSCNVLICWSVQNSNFNFLLIANSLNTDMHYYECFDRQNKL